VFQKPEETWISICLRIGDGPDEVHLRQIFKMETVPSWANSPDLAAHPE
jgi:acyl-CoA dehydrogenase